MNYYDILFAKKLNGGGGGSSVDVEELTVTENGTYTAEEGKAYSPVNVNVGNTFSNKTLTVTYVNLGTKSVTNSEKNVFIWENGGISLTYVVVDVGLTDTLTYVQMPAFNEFHVEVLHYTGSQTPVPTISDAVNCTLAHSSTPISGHFVYEIVVTDITKDASCTISLGGLS